MSLKSMYEDSKGNKLPREFIEWVCEKHKLGRLKKIKGYPRNGNINGIIIIRTQKGKYVIRCLTIKTNSERINYIEEILSRLKKEGVPVLRAIKTIEDQYFSIKDDIIIQVYPYIFGYDFIFNRNQVEANAMTLAKFHRALSSFNSGPLPEVFIYPTLENLDMKIQVLSMSNNNVSNYTVSRIVSLFNAINQHWQKFCPSNLPKTIIHDDWHPWNMLYYSDGSIAAILDYDYIQDGERIYDIAYALYYFYKRAPGDKHKLIKLFIKSYGELLEIEKTVLPIVVAKVALFNILFATNSNSERKIKKSVDENEELIKNLLSKGLYF
ncbi:phosphotransferase [Anaerobacillus sp. CMMVII]|uniref:phosphotransferase n=1 Tax=Anaerobacillus sp. CMMVII TaxID=2755588 RepID=UPI0021B6F696|nr:phosphotransferase [Anaerobacillus sp. CMMVII]MCT8140356.1 phosphotransferase [Anaerobacillus sp. CMMVII]